MYKKFGLYWGAFHDLMIYVSTFYFYLVIQLHQCDYQLHYLTTQQLDYNHLGENGKFWYPYKYGLNLYMYLNLHKYVSRYLNVIFKISFL